MKCVNCGHPEGSHVALGRGVGECRAKKGLSLERCDCTRYVAKHVALKPRKDDPARRRFAAQRNKPYTDWIASLPCLVSDRDCWHPGELVACGRLSDPAHVNATRAQGAPDEGETAPLCRAHHRIQEGRTPEFNAAYCVNLALVADALWLKYEREQMGAPVL